MASPARATLTDLANLAPAWSRLSGISSAKQQAALDVASDYLDGKLAAQFALPLTAPYPQDVIDFEVIFASYRLILNVGFNPQASAADAAVYEQYKAKIEWAESVARGETNPNIAGITTAADISGPEVITSTARGYSERGLASWVPCSNTNPFSDD